MKKTRSKDGTDLAFERTGSGPSVVVVGGAFNDRNSGAALAALLARDHTVFTYDRRGRGASGDAPLAKTAADAVACEIEDLRAIVDEAGGAACAYGISSGGMLVLEAAAAGVPLTRVAAFEVPLVVEGRARPAADLRERITALVADGKRGDAVELFLTVLVEIPAVAVAGMRRAPFWAGMERIAHTLPYDLAIMGDFTVPERFARIAMPVLLLDGEKSPAWMRATTKAIAASLAGAEHRTLAGQTHDVAADVLAPEIARFFAG